MKTRWFVTAAILLMALGACFQPAESEEGPAEFGADAVAEYKVKLAGDRELKIKKYDGKWKAKDKAAEKQWSVKVKESGKYKLISGEDTVVAEGKRDGDKLKLKKPDGSLYLKLKFKEDKIKVYIKDDGDSWSISPR